MKLVNVLFASTAVVLGIAACAAPSEEQGETTESSSQALCPRGMECTPPSTSSGGLVMDPGPTTFTCSGQIPGSSSTDYCSYLRTVCPNGTTTNCKCEQYCKVPGGGPGGGFPIGSWSPCRAGYTYTCNNLGQCRCQ